MLSPASVCAWRKTTNRCAADADTTTRDGVNSIVNFSTGPMGRRPLRSGEANVLPAVDGVQPVPSDGGGRTKGIGVPTTNDGRVRPSMAERMHEDESLRSKVRWEVSLRTASRVVCFFQRKVHLPCLDANGDAFSLKRPRRKLWMCGRPIENTKRRRASYSSTCRCSNNGDPSLKFTLLACVASILRFVLIHSRSSYAW